MWKSEYFMIRWCIFLIVTIFHLIKEYRKGYYREDVKIFALWFLLVWLLFMMGLYFVNDL